MASLSCLAVLALKTLNQYTNMKKLIVSLFGAAILLNANADTVSVTLAANAFTNLLTGGGRLTQLVVTATTATNTSAILVDTSTNTMTYVITAYTNTVSYLTNMPAFYTNYFGVLATLTNSVGTNYVLVDVQQAVAQSTNALPSLPVSAPASTSVTIQSPNQNFMRGIWVTNTGSGVINIVGTVQRF